MTNAMKSRFDIEGIAIALETTTMSGAEIASNFGCSVGTVKRVKKARRIVRPTGWRRRIDHDAIAHDYVHLPQMTLAAIAEAHNCSVGTVDRVASDRGLVRNPWRGGPEARLDHDAIAHDYSTRDDLTVAEIADRHGCGTASVNRLAAARGLSRATPKGDGLTAQILSDYVNRTDLTVEEIASKNQVSRHRVKREAAAAGWDRNRMNRRNRQGIANDYVNRLDLTVAQIAERHNCTRATVHAIVGELDLPKRGRVKFDPAVLALAYTTRTDLTVEELAAEFGCTAATIRLAVIAQGVPRRPRRTQVASPES